MCLKNVSALVFDNNFGKFGLIFKLLSPVDSQDFHLTCNMLLRQLVKSKIQKSYRYRQHCQQTVDMFPRTLWALDLAFSSSWTDYLKTADFKWLINILKFGVIHKGRPQEGGEGVKVNADESGQGG